ncbi:MAG: RdgB/HAM1 family non-canonical purine NTP pyrophosphatase [Treponema sp.]|nr:RdgB/HAM1 family non-canonical purine NTP pyrophosphatase [Treponema sp.]
MKIYLATGNKHKKKEMAELLSNHEIVIPSDEGIDFDPDETGTTFYENSIIKAKALYDIVHAPVIADDSGICVDAISGRPGIYSSRYAGPDFPQGKPDGTKITQDEQNVFLIKELNKALKNPKPEFNSFLNGPRSCHYTCAFVLYLGGDRLYVVQETFEGTLIEDISKQAGNGGFGYDPIVFLPEYGKTVAEISAEEKNAISHRGKAVKAIKDIIDNLS